MTQIEKLLKHFLKQPTSLRYPDIEKVLVHIGFEKISAKGSHVKFKSPVFDHDLVIPVHNKDCKEFYKKQAAKIITQYIKSNKK